MRFLFEVNKYYGKRGPVFYKSQEVHLSLYGFSEYSKIFVWAKYEMRVNGPKTAYGEFYYQVRWPSDSTQWFGWNITKHFNGDNAGLKARGWLNYLLNNCPCYVNQERNGQFGVGA